MRIKTGKKWTRPIIKLPRAAIITICVLPAVLTGLYYALRCVTIVMDWASVYISAPVRGFLGLLSSVYPLSVMEILCAVVVIWLIYYIVKTIMVISRRRGKLKILIRRILPVIVAAVYIWGLFCWLWNSGYYTSGFAKKNGFTGGGVTSEDLTSVARLFADKANEFSLYVKRNDFGHYIEDRSEILAESTDIYQNIAFEFPSLSGRSFAPKPMIFSWLMSRTGYTGIYFALTGEANVNNNMPAFLLPATAAHELAHQHGVFAEDEANFVGIATCIKSGNTVYEYAGYLSGLMYLMNALIFADYEAWIDIGGSLYDEVLLDWQDNNVYWQAQKKVDTGIAFIDRILTSVTETVSDTVDNVYDGFLKSQNQELGLRSYGACVDLLVEYFIGAAYF